MFYGIKKFLFDLFDLFDKADVSGIRKTNSYYRNLKICEKWQKEEDTNKKLKKHKLEKTKNNF